MARVERARWLTTKQSFVGHALVAEGTEVYYTPVYGGHVGSNLSPLNDEAQAIVDAQKQDHPAKAIHAGKRAKAVAAAAEELAEEAKETTDGVVPAPQRKGDTKKEPKAAKAAKEAPKEAAQGKSDDDDDVG